MIAATTTQVTAALFAGHRIYEKDKHMYKLVKPPKGITVVNETGKEYHIDDILQHLKNSDGGTSWYIAPNEPSVRIEIPIVSPKLRSTVIRFLKMLKLRHIVVEIIE